MKWPSIRFGELSFEQLYPQYPQVLETVERGLTKELKTTPRSYMSDANRFGTFFQDLIRDTPALGVAQEAVEQLQPFVYDQFFGMGILDPWLESDSVEDILCDSYLRMDVVAGGQKHSVSPTPWSDNDDLYRWMQRMLARGKVKFNETNPMENAQLPDGSRIICLCAPIVEHAAFALRKHAEARFQDTAYRNSGIAPVELFTQLEAWVIGKQNLLVSGATGSGKSTLTNWLASLIPDYERILVVEDTRELSFIHPRRLSMQAASQGTRIGRGDKESIHIKDLVAATLRMRPDRIIVGEVRGPEAFDMLNAMNTGHDGGITTLHSNSPSEAVMRLESLAVRAESNMPLWALQDLIATTLGYVVQLKQKPQSAERRIVEVAQVLHPFQITQSDDEVYNQFTRRLRENLVIRRLWIYDKQEDALKKMCDPLIIEGQYF